MLGFFNSLYTILYRYVDNYPWVCLQNDVLMCVSSLDGLN